MEFISEMHMINARNTKCISEALSAAELLGIGAARSLELLRDIDMTVTSLTHISDLLRSAVNGFNATAEKIGAAPGKQAHPEELLIPAFESLQDSLNRAYETFTSKKHFAVADHRLNDSDGVVEAYDDLLDVMLQLNESAGRLKWFVMESNCDLEGPHSPVILEDDADIERYLKSL